MVNGGVIEGGSGDEKGTKGRALWSLMVVGGDRARWWWWW